VHKQNIQIFISQNSCGTELYAETLVEKVAHHHHCNLLKLSKSLVGFCEVMILPLHARTHSPPLFLESLLVWNLISLQFFGRSALCPYSVITERQRIILVLLDELVVGSRTPNPKPLTNSQISEVYHQKTRTTKKKRESAETLYVRRFCRI
jgi:hypothetical protein